MLVIQTPKLLDDYQTFLNMIWLRKSEKHLENSQLENMQPSWGQLQHGSYWRGVLFSFTPHTPSSISGLKQFRIDRIYIYIYIIHQMLNLGHVVTKYHHTSIVLAISKPTRANGLQSKASHLFLTLPAVWRLCYTHDVSVFTIRKTSELRLIKCQKNRSFQQFQ